MKKHPFRYTLSFLILILLVFATLADSQESDEQITEESNPTEQSVSEQSTEESNPTEQSSVDQSEQSTEESNPTEQSSVDQSDAESKPTDTQPNTLENDSETSQHTANESKDRTNNSLQIFIIITVAFVILISALVIFRGRHLVRLQQDILNKNELRWQRRLDNSLQGWDERLTFIDQQGNESSQKLEEMEANQSSISSEMEVVQNTIAGVKNRLEELIQTVTDLESAREMNVTPDNTVVYQVDVESTILETQERVEELARAYKDGEPINLDYIETQIPSHNLVLNINWIAQTIREWIAELEQSTVESPDLVQNLKYAEQTIKDKLREIRKESMPPLKPINLETNKELDDIRDQSITYPTRLEGMLIGYELGRKVDEATDAQFISQFIRNNLFNNVARYIPHDQLQGQLDKFLQLADYEVIPVEVGVTEADVRFHEIQGSEQVGVKRGTVAQVITPGLMQKKDKFIVQKPVVIRAE